MIMNFLNILRTSAGGLNAQRLRMNLISSNMANMNTTHTKEGGPYRRKDAVFEAVNQNEFGGTLETLLTDVHVKEIVEDNRPYIIKYDPGHPDANKEGYVAMPNINVIEEMVNMISASRSYEANVSAIKATKDMVNAALEIGR
jgi:flagellar basal-body rod protein FlgC